jgi:hypothetical protein
MPYRITANGLEHFQRPKRYLLDPLPRDHPRRRPGIHSDEISGQCDLCGDNVYHYEPRDASQHGVWRHWSCAIRAGWICEVPVAPHGKPAPGGPPAAKQNQYAAQLRALRTPTLAAMLLEYHDRPDERLPEHAWQIALVRRELGQRNLEL